MISKYKELVVTFYSEPSNPNDYVVSSITPDASDIDFARGVVPKKARKITENQQAKQL